MKNKITVQELRAEVDFNVHSARIPARDCERDIERTITSLRNIASKPPGAAAGPLADTLQKALDEARQRRPHLGRLGYELELKRIALWGGLIQLGWI
jgi:hypothetical protein